MDRKPRSAAPDPKIPDELVVDTKSRAHGSKSGIAILQVFLFPGTVGAILGTLTTPTIALVGMLATVAALVVWWKRAPLQRVVLRVSENKLWVHGKKGFVEPVRLEDLLNVSVDSRTITPLQDGSSAIPAMRIIASKTGPDVDVARIVVVAKGREPVSLVDEELAHMDAMEWLGKIRVFLRKHGWVPEDERDVPHDGEDPPSVVPASATSG